MSPLSEHKMAILVILAALAFLFLILYLPSGQVMASPGLPTGGEPQDLGGENLGAPPKKPRGVIGIQAGHYQAQDFPEAMAELRDSTGAQEKGLREVDVNLSIAGLTVALLVSQGYQAELLPATIPPHYLADAFVSLHADWGQDPRRGWKIAPPWRASPAALDLEKSLKASFYQAGLPEDSQNITINMRGYYGFNYQNYENALSPFTPGVLVEMGYLTNPLDRILLTDGAPQLAEILAQGIENFLKTAPQRSPQELRPPEFSPSWVAPSGAILRETPDSSGGALFELKGGARVFVLQKKVGWAEVFVRDQGGHTGWISLSDLK